MGNDTGFSAAGTSVGIVSGNVGIAGEGVADQHGIIFSGIELSVGFIGDSHFGHRRPVFTYSLAAKTA